jgi:hypothetical protein
MTRRLSLGLAPLLAIAAMSVIPAATQAACTAPACPHVYRNGVMVGEGKKLQVIGWGTIKFTNSHLGEVECHNIGAGYVENPIGGGIAVGKGEAQANYECESPSCKLFGGKIESTPESLPWAEELIEPEPGVFRIKIGKKGKETGSIVVRSKCLGLFNEQFFGEQTPKILNNGVSIGALPGEGEFDAGAGALESTFFGTGTTTGRVKSEGYGAQELVEVKNP